ncbi:MAG TPA: Stp1/IreP family PP2C-type Ser/Thr phosphatase, partial [Blastocatellia bacterium]|nr:Stp1/IreP family PP2C-type Ser/Thr phosphatase [Blastocatellia bacterium]
MELRVGTVTDRGLNPRRTLNEDRLLALSDSGLFAVCDGVGGHNSGEVASQMVVDALAKSVNGSPVGDKEDFIELALQRVNHDIFDLASRDSGMRGMATTVALVWIDDKSALIAHVGDSRVYRFSKNRLTQETTDHTVVEDAIRAGQMTEQEAQDHPMKHVINRAIGIEPEVEPEFSHIKANDGDTFLLCSDGITGHIPDAELKELLSSPASPQQICQELKNRCYSRGADDNLTAVVVRLGGHADDDATLQTARKGKQNGTQVFKQSRLTTKLGNNTGETQALNLPGSRARITVPVGGGIADTQFASTGPTPPFSDATSIATGVSSLTKRIVLALLFCGLLIGAFYGGMW